MPCQEISMVVTQRMSEQEYQEAVLTGMPGNWELHDGRLVEKPGMTFEHDDIAFELGRLLGNQLDRRQFRIAVNGWRVRRPAATVFIPDLVVIPIDYAAEFRGQPGKLAIFSQPLPLVVEVWSTSTGDYDIDAKLPIYQQRGDLEIWRIHPYERTLTAWQRLPDASYQETVHRGGTVTPVALPNVEIDLDQLFAS
jgi:Uma2 family endonuclease